MIRDKYIKIGTRKIGPNHPPFVIPEIGINHEGNFKKAIQMINDAHKSGAECVKFQCHVIEDEMIPKAKKVIPGNAKESIWNIMQRCALSEEEDIELKKYTEKLGMIYLSTPFSRAAADRLERMGVLGYKIGSGECNNYPLIDHIASFRRPIILSTGMNDISSIKKAVAILTKRKVQYALLHCTSMYPTPYEKVRLNSILEMQRHFPKSIVGLSDHSLGNYTCFGAVALGASILEKHFTSDKKWAGPDVPISIDPSDLKDLILGSRAIFEAKNGSKQILVDEKPTIDFAYASIVSIKDIKKGERLSMQNVWVKRPGINGIRAEFLSSVIGLKAKQNIKKDQQIKWREIQPQKRK